MVVFCLGCGSRISVEAASRGGDVECPRCHSTFPTAGVKDAANAPQPKRFRPKKKEGSRFALAATTFAVLFIITGGIAGLLYYTGMFARWAGSPTSSTAGHVAPQPTWQEYTNLDAKFRVLFPGTPTRDTIPSPSKLKPGAKPKAVSFTAETPDVTFSVIYEDHDAKAEEPEQAIERHRAEIVAGRGGVKLVSEKDVTAGTQKGKEFVVDASKGQTAHIRFFPAGRRLYKLMALGTHHPPDASEAAKFFESFQILE